jgi:hypothetical protein
VHGEAEDVPYNGSELSQPVVGAEQDSGRLAVVLRLQRGAEPTSGEKWIGGACGAIFGSSRVDAAIGS